MARELGEQGTVAQLDRTWHPEGFRFKAEAGGGAVQVAWGLGEDGPFCLAFLRKGQRALCPGQPKPAWGRQGSGQGWSRAAPGPAG